METKIRLYPGPSRIKYEEEFPSPPVVLLHIAALVSLISLATVVLFSLSFQGQEPRALIAIATLIIIVFALVPALLAFCAYWELREVSIYRKEFRDIVFRLRPLEYQEAYEASLQEREQNSGGTSL
jgi:hypothetical protein